MFLQSQTKVSCKENTQQKYYRFNQLKTRQINSQGIIPPQNTNRNLFYQRKINTKNCLCINLMSIISKCLNLTQSFQGLFFYKIKQGRNINMSIQYNFQFGDIDEEDKKQIIQIYKQKADQYFEMIIESIDKYQERVHISQFKRQLQIKLENSATRYDCSCDGNSHQLIHLKGLFRP